MTISHLVKLQPSLKISRQAVYEHIKRAEQVLENYESKLGLLEKHERRNRNLEDLQNALERAGVSIDNNKQIHDIVAQLSE